MTESDALAAAQVLVLMPSRKDAERATALLAESAIASTVCSDLATMCRALRSGVGALLLTDEAIASDTSGQLAEALRAQPTWSVVPIVVITHESASRHFEQNAGSSLPGLIIVERPVRTRTLLSVMHSALRARQNQYQIRDVMVLLARQAEQLRTADRKKDEFLATLAHELRNPLAPVQTGLDLLERSREGAVAERALGIMRRQLRHMVRLIDDLLDVSRITQGKFELKRAHVTLAEVLDAAVEASRPFIERSNQTLRVEVNDSTLALHADLTRLAQVISNLLNNASKYTHAGGTIELTAERSGNECIISVRDDGIGIPEQHLEHVFEMFSQIERASERTQGGLGIGLALVKSLVGLHGGSVSATSAGPGKGSTFTVRLPLAPTEDTSAGETDGASVQPRGKRRILLVDDNEDAVDLLSLMLESAGFETNTANDGPAALAAFDAWAPDVVILDIGLPGMSGYDVARELRDRPRANRLELIALSGWGSQEDEAKARAAGFDVHLTKPVDADRLYRALEPRPR